MGSGNENSKMQHNAAATPTQLREELTAVDFFLSGEKRMREEKRQSF